MVCLRESLPEVREQIQNLADKLGVDYGTAKIILQENNGYDLDKAPSGAESKLYQTLLEHYNGDERKALIAKAKTYLQPFFDWFGNWTDPDVTGVSKVVDENGEPLVVVHTTDEIFDTFDLSYFGNTDEGYHGKGFYFSKTRISEKYGLIPTMNYGKNRMFCFLNIKNPAIDKSVVKNWETTGKYDGAFTAPINGKILPEIIALNPNQIKSIDNQGTFSTTDNNINKSSSEQELPPSDKGLKERLFNGKDSASIGSMLTRLKKDNPNFSSLITMLQKGLSVRTKGWQIKLVDFKNSIEINENESNSAAFYRHIDHTIYVNINAAFPVKGDKVGKADMTLLHEIIHAATHEAIINNAELREQLTHMLNQTRKALSKKYGQSLEQLLNSSINQNKFYGLTDVEEFLSEAMTNSFFVKELASLPSTNPVKKIWDEFVEWIMNALDISNKDNMFNEAYSKLSEILTTYQQYNEQLNDLTPINAADIEYDNYINAIYGSSAMRSINTKKPTVNELVEKYNKLSDDIEFIKEQDGKEVHIYRNRKTGQIYKSVSDVKTDVGYGEQEDKLPEHAVALGDFTKVKGTLLHEALADLITGKFNAADYKQLPSKVISQLRSIAKNITDKYTIIASEQVLADDESGIAGTADLIVQDKKTKKIIILDFKTKIKNLGEQKKSGFAYYHSSKFGKPDAEKHNFQLSMYEKMHNLYGFEIDERGIVPIEYDTDNDGNILSVYITPQSKGTTLENKGYYTIPHRSQIDQDIDQYAFGGNIDQLMDQIQLDRQSEIVGKILDTLKNKVVSLYSKGRSTQATDIENTVNEFNSLSEQEIIIEYIKTALDNLKNIIDGKKVIIK